MNWEMKKLGEISTIKAGGTPSRSKNEYWQNGHIPWVKIGDLDSKYINFAKEKITREGLENSSAKLLKKDTILYTIFATLGKVAILNCDATTNQAIAGIYINHENVDINYMYYYLKSIKGYVLNIGRGVAQNNINLSILKDLEIPLPPLGTQKKIAQVLDKAQELIDKRKEQIEKLDEFIQSVFLDMFGDSVKNPKGWEERKLEEVTEFITDGKHGDCENDYNSGYYFIGAREIRNGVIDYTTARQITEKDFIEVDKRTNLQVGDLVIVNTGATIGKTAVVKDDVKTRKTTFQKSVAIIKVKKELLDVEYLKALYANSLGHFTKKSSGSAQKNLLLSQMRRTMIPLPNIEIQNQFAEIVQKTEQQKELLQKSLKEMENNFNSLMQRAFKGELFR